MFDFVPFLSIIIEDALQEQRFALAAAINSTVGESSPTVCTHPNEKMDEIYEPIGIDSQYLPRRAVLLFQKLIHLVQVLNFR